ncbi:hypothetical protein [Arenibacter sp. GZD-96]|uniref:hypothetical protein n=1 Tax=Aurantibrevibacter litoralis TaxID=3106030 RepID=UPI002AFF87BC|nr:hypothetical protein [Arenibacter sp. GZD-96]
MIIKVSAFHVYSHENENDNSPVENCAVCNLVSNAHHDQFVVAPVAQIQPPPPIVVLGKVHFNYTIVSLRTTVPFYAFSRPPPFFV